MNLRRLLLITLALLHPAASAGPLEEGMAALNARLWEVAEFRFTEAIADTSLDEAARSQATIGLAHAKILNGRPAEALPLLENPPASGHPDAPFWKAMALAGIGRFNDAASLLEPIANAPSHPHQREAAFTRSSLQLSLQQPAAALATLQAYIDSLASSPNAAAEAKLRQAAIHLDLLQPAEARNCLPSPDDLHPRDAAHFAFIEASTLLAEQRFAEAAAAFSAILDEPKSQPLARHHAAALGLADAKALMGESSAATELLLDFIQKNPTSPLLDAIFERLLKWLPETPSTTHTLIKRLPQWINPSTLPITGIIASPDAGASAAWPKASSADDLAAFALFTLANALHRTADPTAQNEARLLLARLRLEHPSHFLTDRALILAARWHLQENRADLAFNILDSLRESANASLIRGESAFIEARAAYNSGDQATAVKLFQEAAENLPGPFAAASHFNAALASLHSGNPVLPVQNPATIPPTLAADLELEQALALTDPSSSLAAIESFLQKYPSHPRAPEARLAAAETALIRTPPDPSLARAQLDTLAIEPAAASLPPARIHLARLRLADLDEDPAAAIASARSFIETFPDDAARPEAALTLGRKLFEAGDYNDSRLVLEELATQDANPVRAQAAMLIAARSAALVATTQSKTEALALFDRTIAIDGPLDAVATHEKARLMIDLNLLEEATTFLRTSFDALPPDDPSRLPAGLLLAEACYARGGKNPSALEEALAVYDQLLAATQGNPALVHRLQYNRAMILERLPNPENPELTREAEAFDVYYSVIVNATNPPAEWHYFENCGRRALDILEKAQRWQAAVKLAEKIASFQGPSATTTAERAKQLRLKHMIWED